jgi:hypothetical protein
MLVWRRCAGHLTERDLFNVAGAVLRVWSAAGEGDAVVCAVANEQSVDELTSIVAIEPQDWERQICLQSP